MMGLRFRRVILIGATGNFAECTCYFCCRNQFFCYFDFEDGFLQLLSRGLNGLVKKKLLIDRIVVFDLKKW